jgi:hypothetical protein
MDKNKFFLMWESEFYDKYSDSEILIDEDFRSIAIGFFISKGLNIEESLEMYQFCISKKKW